MGSVGEFSKLQMEGILDCLHHIYKNSGLCFNELDSSPTMSVYYLVTIIVQVLTMSMCFYGWKNIQIHNSFLSDYSNNISEVSVLINGTC